MSSPNCKESMIRKILKIVVPRIEKITIGRYVLDRMARLNTVIIYWRITGKLGYLTQTYEENHASIWDYIRTHNPKNIMEIGLGDGRSARKIISIAKNCEFFSFDILERSESREAFLELNRRDNVHFYIGDSKLTLPLAVKELPPMDVVVIDGGHDIPTVKKDWEKCKLLLKKDGVCFFHDSEGFGPWMTVGRIGDGFSVEYIAGTLPLITVVKRTGEVRNVRDVDA